MSFKEACGKARCKTNKNKSVPVYAMNGKGQKPADNYTDRDFPAKKSGKKGGFAEAATNAKKKKSKK